MLAPKWTSVVHKTGGKNSTSHVDHHVTYGNALAWHIPHFQTHPMVGTSAPTRTSLAHRPQSLAQHCVRMHVFQSRLPCQLRKGAGMTQHDSAWLSKAGSIWIFRIQFFSHHFYLLRPLNVHRLRWWTRYSPTRRTTRYHWTATTGPWSGRLFFDGI